MAVLALCDDDERQLQLAAKEIENYNHSLSPDETRFTIRPYTSPSALWFDMMDTHIADLFLLDIDMPQMSGIELAQKIHDQAPASLIIFLTSHLEYARDGYKVRAFRFVSKSRLREELPEALRSAAAELKRIQEYIAFSAEDVLVRVPLTDILYVQRVDRKLVIHTLSQGILQNNQGIKEFFDSLHSDHFLFIDRGTFVNVDHIERIDRTDLTVAPTKERLAISRRQLKNVKESLARFWSL